MADNEKNEKHVSVKIHEKPERRRLRVGDPDFVPPDGGWGWLIVFACGFSNLSTFPMFQQFGLVFRSKFEELGISSSQTTTVINMNSAFNACVGLLNGPVFRKFTYRQVAMVGSLLVSSSLFLSRFCQSFWAYLFFYSACYGAGIGITQSSNALALNTYFKNKRRIATGLSWTTTAMGPIVWPHIIVALNAFYGMEGTLLLFAGFALHAFVCSLLLQPVEWHTQFRDVNPESAGLLEPDTNVHPPISNKLSYFKRQRSLVSSQYLHNEDDPLRTGYEITDPGMPMMIKSNDGWYSQLGSRVSLASSKSKRPSEHGSQPMSTRPSFINLTESRSRKHSMHSQPISTRPSFSNLPDARDKSAPKEKKRRKSQTKPIEEGVEFESIEDEKQTQNGTGNSVLPNEKEVLKSAAKKLEEYKEHEQEQEPLQESPEDNSNDEYKELSIWKKISIFFDFELFKDPIYVNLMLGITVANFAELNFSILTPMVLKEFNFTEFQTATFMSLLGVTDIVTRFFIPFLADTIGWTNKTFFIVGVMAMAMGRIILVHTQTYGISLFVAAIIGAGKGLRTIFMALVIPSYVPLERLPAASGLQLATSGILFIILGPIVGWIREVVNNYVVTLHILNICTYATAIAWTIEWMITRKYKSEASSKSKPFKNAHT